jgi:dihydropteroate synthase
VDAALALGIAPDRIVVDPGVGFAKRSEHSLRILAALQRVKSLGFPVMVGVSRKRFIGELSGMREPSERNAGSVGANVAALMLGAQLFRVHDVASNRQALDVAWGIMHTGQTLSRTGGSSRAGPDSRFPIPDSP